MEKENLLEIEIKKINDKYSVFYPVKMDIEKLKEFTDGNSLGDGEYIPYIDLSINSYGYTILLTNEETFPQVIKNECIDKLKEEVEKINKKCGIPKRWRAEKGGEYLYIDSTGEITVADENNSVADIYRYRLGNYFMFEKQAIEVTKSKEYKDFWAKVRAGEIGGEE